MFNDLKIHTNLLNKFIITNPHFDYDEMRSDSVIFILEDEGGVSFGFLINNNISLEKAKDIIINNSLDSSYINLSKDFSLHRGGSSDSEKIFVVHSSDYRKNILFRLNKDISLSSNMEILDDILNDQGPKNSLVLIGYCKWENYRLEKNIEKYNWIVADYDFDILFCQDSFLKWQKACEKFGLSKSGFLQSAGNA